MVYKGDNPRNYIQLDEIENGTVKHIEYRIISVEPDGSIKVVRQSAVKSIAYDSTDIYNSPALSGPRLNSENPYCMQWNGSVHVYTGASYYGCSAWGKKFGTINRVENTLISTDSEIKTYLNNEFYGTLAESTKEIIITHSFNITGNTRTDLGNNNLKLTTLYQIMNGINKEEWEGKIGLPTIYDWFMSTTNTLCKPDTIGNGFYQNNDSEYECGEQNYLKTNYHWWTMSPRSVGRQFVWYVNNSGAAYDYYVTYNVIGVRPVFFLSPNLQFTGDGTKGKPYKIKS